MLTWEQAGLPQSHTLHTVTQHPEGYPKELEHFMLHCAICIHMQG